MLEGERVSAEISIVVPETCLKGVCYWRWTKPIKGVGQSYKSIIDECSGKSVVSLVFWYPCYVDILAGFP